MVVSYSVPVLHEPEGYLRYTVRQNGNTLQHSSLTQRSPFCDCLTRSRVDVPPKKTSRIRRRYDGVHRLHAQFALKKIKKSHTVLLWENAYGTLTNLSRKFFTNLSLTSPSASFVGRKSGNLAL